MDGRPFDALTTTLAAHHSRRGFSRLLAGGALGAFAAIAVREATDAKAKAGQPPAAKQGTPDRNAKTGKASAAADGNGSVGASGKRKHRCRYSQAICAKNGQCCPSTSGYICAWNGNANGANVCCGVANTRCLEDWDCCGQAICLLGVCTNIR